jgi:hypothetical protein
MRPVVLPLALVTALACATTEGEADKSRGDAKSSADEQEEPQAAEPEPEPVAAEGGGNAPEAGDPDAPPPGVKTKGNLPVMTKSELAVEDTKRQACIEDCVEANKMQARSPEDIEQGCRSECEAKFPVRQVELVPDAPPGVD